MVLKDWIYMYKVKEDGREHKLFVCKICGFDDEGNLKKRGNPQFRRIRTHIAKKHGVIEII